RRRRVCRPFDVTGLGGGDTRAATRLSLQTPSLRRRCEWERDQADEQDQTLHATPPLHRTKNRAPARTARGPIGKVIQLMLRCGDVAEIVEPSLGTVRHRELISKSGRAHRPVLRTRREVLRPTGL